MTTLQRMMGAALAATVGFGVYEAARASRLNQEHRRLVAEQEQLTRERDQALKRLGRATNAAPRLPAPEIQVSSPAEAVADPSPTNFLRRMIEGDTPKLTSEQVESYLKENHRNAASLLAMARVTGDISFLKEAMEKFPDDPRVAFDAVFVNSDSSAEERRQWVEQFKQNAPDNALASYVSALDYFKSGQSDQAVQELVAASAKPQFQDYFWDQVQSAEEAWRASGFSEQDARWLGTSQSLLPELAQMKQLNQSIMDLANAYRQGGDTASAEAAIQYNLQLGERLAQSPNDPLITQLVGAAIQRNALSALDPNSLYGTTGQTVADRIEQLKQQRKLVRDLNQQIQPLLPLLSPQDFITWADRRRAYGELNAMQWMISKYGSK
jgi:hypothetical protein